MKYKNTKYKLRKIYRKLNQHSNDILVYQKTESQIKDKVKTHNLINTLKRKCLIYDTDFEDMEYNDRTTYYSAMCKEWEINFENIPIYFLYDLNYNIIFKGEFDYNKWENRYSRSESMNSIIEITEEIKDENGDNTGMVKAVLKVAWILYNHPLRDAIPTTEVKLVVVIKNPLATT